jgi:glycosyltransferase involved in cell wall biosynthesis
LPQTKLGKSRTIYRLIDFFTFYVSITWKLLFVSKKKYDIIIGTTVPPLLSFFAIVISRVKGIPFYYWVMDLQPELSIKAGLINQNSLSARLLTGIGNYSICNAKKVISLDRFMTEYLLRRGAKLSQVYTIPVWPVMDTLYEGTRESNPFRIEHGFGDRIVVMYSGNHAYIHPLDTLLDAILLLRDDPRFIFVFVGGGIRKKDVIHFQEYHQLNNIIQLPFQPRNNIHNSLGASDIQVVVMGEGQVGYTHPNKIYGALYIGKPVVYIGPDKSHVADILDALPGNISVQHGESAYLAAKLIYFASLTEAQRNEIGLTNRQYTIKHFSPEVLKRKMLQAIEN